MKTNYAITHVSKDLRILTLGNQWGHFPTEAAAKEWLAQSLALGPNGLAKVLTPTQLATLEVRAVECYDHASQGHTHFQHGGCGDAARSVWPVD